jgi:predicted amidohydrolase YtcJ
MTDARRFSGGRIHTGRRLVESLLVEDGRVVTAGSDDECRRGSPTGTEVVPLLGRTLVPGLIDAHLHLAEMTRVREGLDLSRVRSINDLREVLETWAARHPSGPVVGRGWSADYLVEGRDPTASDLDRTIADRPVVLYHASGHSAVLNRSALEAVGYSDRTPDPPGGRLGRGSDGALNGLVFEQALTPVGRRTREADPPEPAALGRTLRLANATGLTTVGTLSTEPEEFRALRAAIGSSPPTLRIVCYGRAGRWDDFLRSEWDLSGTGSGVSLVGVKAFADGAFGPRTAWLTEPYADRPNDYGVPVLRGAELRTYFERCREEGCAPAVHAIGDRALDEVLRTLEQVGAVGPRPPRVEHASLVPPSAFPLLDRVRPALVVQPGFVWTDSWLGQRLEPARVRWAYPFRTLLAHGHAIAGSSDAPFDSSDPWVGLAAALDRVAPGGGSANSTPEETLTVDQALALYTGNAAVALGETDRGCLEAGYRADLVITDAPDLERAIGAGAGGVVSTWVGGACVFDRAAGGTL